MKTFRLLSCLLVLAAAFAPARAQLSFGVDRTELITELAPGVTRTLRFNVDNPGTETLPMTVYAEDFEIADGAPVFSQKSGPRSLAASLTVFPASFELKPGQSREVTVTLKAGAGPFVPGSYFAAVFAQSSRLTEAAVSANQKGSRVSLNRRLGIYVVADFQPESRPLPADVTLTALDRSANGVTIKVSNPSAYMRSVTGGSLQITPVAGGKPFAKAVRPFRLLPGTVTTIELNLPDAAKGRGEASVLAVVDYGAEDLLVGERRLKF